MENIFKLSDDWADLIEQRTIVPFGIGRIGRRVVPILMKDFEIPFLIDNGNHEGKVCGLDVLNLNDAALYLLENHVKVVVTTVFYAYEKIRKELEALGFIENKDFCILERFAEEWNLRWRNKCVLSKIDTVITSRCTLKCKHCNLFIGHVPEQFDIDLNRLKNNFNIFFESVDFVYEYTLLGGEPFLHKNIGEIILYLGDKYRDKIGQINLISNGTIVYPRNGFKTDNPRRHMLLCGHSTHSVSDGKLYWCDPALAAECFMGFPSKEDDFLDMGANKKNHTKYEATCNIIKYLLGDVNARGYMSICEKCAGVGIDNNVVVIAGEQMKRGE